MKESINMTAETALGLALWKSLDKEGREQMVTLMREMIADQESVRTDDAKGEAE